MLKDKWPHSKEVIAKLPYGIMEAFGVKKKDLKIVGGDVHFDFEGYNVEIDSFYRQGTMNYRVEVNCNERDNLVFFYLYKGRMRINIHFHVDSKESIESMVKVMWKLLNCNMYQTSDYNVDKMNNLRGSLPTAHEKIEWKQQMREALLSSALGHDE